MPIRMTPRALPVSVWLRRLASAAALVLVASRPSLAAGGAGELTLDRGAIAAILAANLPAPIEISVPPLGAITIEVSGPRSVQFLRGGVEASLGIAVDPVLLRGEALVRYVPEVDAADGIVRFRAERATLGGALAILPDLAPLLPPLELPRSFELTPAGRGAQSTPMTVAVQGVAVESERVIVKLGLSSRPQPLRDAKR